MDVSDRIGFRKLASAINAYDVLSRAKARKARKEEAAGILTFFATLRLGAI